MPNVQEADRKLVAWLTERTDPQLERIMEAPDDGFTHALYVADNGDKCLAAWAGGWTKRDLFGHLGQRHPWEDEAVRIMHLYENGNIDATDCTETAIRIKAFTAAELLTRRVNRKKLPAPNGPQASVDGCGEIYALEAE